MKEINVVVTVAKDSDFNGGKEFMDGKGAGAGDAGFVVRLQADLELVQRY